MFLHKRFTQTSIIS